MLFLRATLFSAGMIVSTIIFALLCPLTIVFPFTVRYRFISQWRHFNLWLAKTVCHIDYEIAGIENLPDEPSIVFCKHQSAWETLAIARFLPPHVWVLKRELLWVPFFGWGLAMLKPIAIDRAAGRRAVKQIIAQGKQRLADGQWVVVFPEGTRVAAGQQKKFGIGGAILAEASGAPVVPIAHNAGYFWPRRQFIKQPGTVKVVIGKPIATRGRKAADINAEAENWINDTVAQLGASS
ncbi:MAG: lysophospholipid acyltransferase family protein [Granulosicoccaceae bacterium]|jgi:1-acyl-sn-glycerol-3-phosphate acyltransferase